MACSKYEYVKKFESSDAILPNSYIVVRIDGKGFTKFTDAHKYAKPNDINGISLMNRCAEKVMETFNEIWLAYGQSDEFSFVFRRDAQLFQRRLQKIVSCVVSCFSSSFVFYFQTFFKDKVLQDVPMFDGRCVVYPTVKSLRDYLAWRQVDCHINNLYNTCFWALVQQGNKSNQEAEKILKDTLSDQKNEILFSQFGINYNNIEEIYKKGSIFIRLPTVKAKFQVQQQQNSISKADDNSDNISLSQCLDNNNIKVNENDIIKEDNVNNPITLIDNKQMQQDQSLQDKQQKQGKQTKGKSKQNDKVSELTSYDSSIQKTKNVITLLHEDLIKDYFWEKYKNNLYLCDN